MQDIQLAYEFEFKNLNVLECGACQDGSETLCLRNTNNCYYIEAKPIDYKILLTRPGISTNNAFYYALTDYCGEVTFKTTTWPGNSSIDHSKEHHEELVGYGASFDTIIVPCITYQYFIDEIIRKPIDILVLDIEGHECTVLNSMKKLPVNKLPKIIFIEAGYNWLDRMSILKELDYTIDFYHDNNVCLSHNTFNVKKNKSVMNQINKKYPYFIWGDKIIFINDLINNLDLVLPISNNEPLVLPVSNNEPLMLPVSIGEAVDKLSILDIKIQKIKDVIKQESCKQEFHAILPYIKSFLANNMYLYNCMIYINKMIWDLQDSIRSIPNEVNSGEILHEILDLNDMRFRIKKRLNFKVSSGLQEQKGYSKRVGLCVGHLGLGDIINMAGAIRYCALDVDLLYVVCKQRYRTTVQELFSDDPYIQIVECSDDDREVPNMIMAESINGNSITQRYLSGVWSGESNNTNIPFSFYDTLGLPHEIRKLFFFVKPANELELPETEYIFTHAGTSNTKNKSITSNWDSNTMLTIDPNTNHYPIGHKWYTIAEGYVNKPFLQYKRLIENAKEIHVTDSSFYCLTCFLKCSASKKVCYDRSTGECSKEYFFQ
jgi:FkbM family methyltransferase